MFKLVDGHLLEHGPLITFLWYMSTLLLLNLLNELGGGGMGGQWFSIW